MRVGRLTASPSPQASYWLARKRQARVALQLLVNPTLTLARRSKSRCIPSDSSRIWADSSCHTLDSSRLARSDVKATLIMAGYGSGGPLMIA
jgi:hypothetical protein